MIYKLLHKLFGWDYVAWQNSSSQGIARVHVSADGIVWYWRYKSTQLPDQILRPQQVLWLTCHPAKYFPENSADQQGAKL